MPVRSKGKRINQNFDGTDAWECYDVGHNRSENFRIV